MRKFKIIICIMTIACVISSCGKQKNTDENVATQTDVIESSADTDEMATTQTDVIASMTDTEGTATTEETITTEITTEETTEELIPYDYENLRDDEASGVYNIISLFGEDIAIVDAGVYDEDHIVAISGKYDNGTYERQIDLLRVTTGTIEKTFSDTGIENQNNDDFDDEEARMCLGKFKIYNTNPLIIENSFTGKLELFNAELTGFVEVSDGSQLINAVCVTEDYSKVYYSINDGTIYELNQEKVKAECAFNGKEIHITDYSSVVYKPEYYLDYIELLGFEDNGNIIVFNAIDRFESEYVRIKYNVNTKKYVESNLFKDEIYIDYANDDESIVFIREYDDELERTEVYMYDYTNSKTYLASPNAQKYVMNETGESNGMVNIMKNSLGIPNKVLMGVTNGYDDKYFELLLWNYTNEECVSDREIIDLSVNYVPYEMHEYVPLSNELEAKFDYFEEKYGIVFIAGANVVDRINEYNCTPFYDEKAISEKLDQFEELLNFYPEGTFKEMVNGWVSAMVVYVAGDIIPEEGQVDAAACVDSGQNYVNMLVESEYMSDSTIIHELMHALEYKLKYLGVDDEFDEEWTSYNPAGFEYYTDCLDYINASDTLEYTMDAPIAVNDNNAIYFIDSYAKSNTMEDKARTVEAFSQAIEEYSFYDECFESEHLQNKIICLVNYLKDNYESFDNFDKCKFGEVYKGIFGHY